MAAIDLIVPNPHPVAEVFGDVNDDDGSPLKEAPSLQALEPIPALLGSPAKSGHASAPDGAGSAAIPNVCEGCGRSEILSSLPVAAVKDVRPDVLRGISASQLLRCTLLQRAGLLWRGGPSRLSEGNRSSLYSTSFPVKVLDTFLSHAWRAAGWQKFVQLTLDQNVIVAAQSMAGLLVTLGALSASELIPPFGTFVGSFGEREVDVALGLWCTVFVPMLGMRVLFFGSLLPRRTSQVVFLDVACICQTDEALKAEGIRALGTFLSRSRRLKIMWSTHYFSRLWCVYELASFLHLHRGGSIEFRPLFVDSALLVCFLIWWLWTTLGLVSYILLDEVVIASVCGFVPIVFAMHLARKFMREQRSLVHQIETFDCRAAECQDSGDREFIMSSVQSWYGSEDDFNCFVRDTVKHHMLANTIQSPAFCYRNFLLVSIGALIGAATDLWVSFWLAGAPLIRLASIGIGFTGWVGFLVPAFTKAFWLLAERFAAARRTPALDVLLTTALFTAWAMGFAVAQAASSRAYNASIWGAIGSVALEAALAFAVHRLRV